MAVRAIGGPYQATLGFRTATPRREVYLLVRTGGAMLTVH
jgi:hypothetical protein